VWRKEDGRRERGRTKVEEKEEKKKEEEENKRVEIYWTLHTYSCNQMFDTVHND